MDIHGRKQGGKLIHINLPLSVSKNRQRFGRGDFPLSQPYPTTRVATRVVEVETDAHVLGFSI